MYVCKYNVHGEESKEAVTVVVHLEVELDG